jgi:hypothetical protein
VVSGIILHFNTGATMKDFLYGCATGSCGGAIVIWLWMGNIRNEVSLLRTDLANWIGGHATNNATIGVDQNKTSTPMVAK